MFDKATNTLREEEKRCRKIVHEKILTSNNHECIRAYAKDMENADYNNSMAVIDTVQHPFRNPIWKIKIDDVNQRILSNESDPCATLYKV